MAEETILESTERTSGREALRKNVQAAIALAGAVRSTLGPKGLDKLLVDDSGQTLVTNDGVTVLESAKVEHPVAKMIISASSTQDRVARDGTTSTVVICAEMLRNAWQLVRQGIHPATIARGYALAESFAISALDELSIDATREQIHAAIETSLAGKLDQSMGKHLANLALDAGEIIVNEGRADPTMVKVIKQTGGSMNQTALITGLALAKSKIHPEMNERGGPGSILLLDGGIERRKTQLDTKLNITSAGMIDAFRKSESKSLLSQVENLVEIGCDLLVCKEGIDEEARQSLSNNGILTYRRVEKKDLDLLSRACGANLVPDAGRAGKGDLGAFIKTREELRGGINNWILDAEDGGATLIVRGSTDGILDEVERCFADGLGVACQLLEDPVLLPGAGATQVALARRLRRHAESVPGREQMAIEAWADALESIPRALAGNAGYDGIDSLLKLTAAQNSGGDSIGLDLLTGEPNDTIKRGVLEPLNITRQAISGATEAAISILRIDDVLWAQMDAQIPDGVQEQLQGFGAE
ncbi:MAG: thermosome subunit [Euryarchaeota archaeon]|jgi:chaperonin GroEL (HSP60 family)|nr:thermosome subunit [Euryarchaeota archaeon]MBT4982381.1 thermosome subunit [Euryarchaeota archaeon]MBT5184029.1 thermosome subunit [Euryarchaeota archaeon]